MPPRDVSAAGLLRRLGPPADAESDAALLDRFARDRDEGAFAALVGRHGPLVLGVCRRTLGDPHAADDAFQATFLVLARKAGSLARPTELAAWLHGVARRVALKARTDRRRRTATGGEAAPPDRGRDPLAELTGRELLAVLEEEVQRLPAAYRLPVALCCLEGLSQDEAARRLRCTAGALRGRLERGRARLQARLTKRGVLPAAAVAVLGLTRVTAAALPAGVAGLTARAALQFSNRTPAAVGAVPTAAASLAEGVLNAMIRSKLKVAAAGLLALALAVTGPVLIADPTAKADPPPAATPKEPPAGGEKPARAPALLALEKKLVGKWVGFRGFVVPMLTLAADGTFTHSILDQQSEGTWAVDWDALPPSLVLTVTRSNDPAAPAGTVLKRKVESLDDKQLALENPNATDPWPAPRPILYARAKENPAAGGKPDPKGRGPEGKPGRADVVGEWRSHNGLAGVFFNLELKNDGTFTLSHREVAPKLDLVIAGKWSHDGDRVTLQEERQLVDGKRVELEGGLFFPRGRTDTLTVARKDGRWVVTHGRGIEFTRYTPQKGGGLRP